ncbi:hypothetical protein L7F22_029716 [Adiantum nelumboides]|nr:hypothetical protein [Adiantum nelumboides]
MAHSSPLASLLQEGSWVTFLLDLKVLDLGGALFSVPVDFEDEGIGAASGLEGALSGSFCSLCFDLLEDCETGPSFLLWLEVGRRKVLSQPLSHDAPPIAGKTQQIPTKRPASHSNKPRAADKGHLLQHHGLLANTLKGHTDAISGFCFTSNGRGLATASGDGVARVFKLEDVSSKNIKFLHLNLPSGNTPTAVAFGEGKAAADAKGQGKLPPPAIKWEKHAVHDRKNIISLAAASATYGSGDGSVIIASCSEGTDIKLWLAADGKCVGTADTNQLKNNMATLSPDGRFLAAAAFTADVKVWELVYGKDGSIREVRKVMQLKGHKRNDFWKKELKMAGQAEEIALLKAQVAEMSAVLALPQVKDFLKTLAKGKEKGQEQGKEHDVNAHAVIEEGEPSKKPWDEDIPESSLPSYSPSTSFSYSSDSSSSSNPRRRSKNKERSLYPQQFSDCFSDSLPSQLPPERPEDHAMDLVSGNSPPNRLPYKVSAAQQKVIMSSESGPLTKYKNVVSVFVQVFLESAVTWLDFTSDASGIVTASKDGTIRVWNINVRYHLDEDPKCLKTFRIPLQDLKGLALHYDRLAVSPDNKTLAVTHGSTLQWLDLDTGEVIDSIDNAHDGFISGIAWSPQPLPTEKGRAIILATAGVDKRIRLWFPPR